MATDAAYERFFGPITDRLLDPILDALAIAPGCRLIDVACGPGNLSAQAVARGAPTRSGSISPSPWWP